MKRMLRLAMLSIQRKSSFRDLKTNAQAFLLSIELVRLTKKPCLKVVCSYENLGVITT